MKAFVIAAIFLTFGVSGNTHAQTVQGDSLIIHLKSGERVAIALSTIQKITFDTSSSEAVQVKPPSASGLQVFPNFPNPSQSGTNIRFTIATAGNVSLDIFDSKENLIRHIELPNCQTGQNQIQWDGLNNCGAPVPSGAYFYEVRFGNEIQTKQMVVIK